MSISAELMDGTTTPQGSEFGCTGALAATFTASSTPINGKTRPCLKFKP